MAVFAQENDGLDAVLTIQRAFQRAIKRAEPAVVSIMLGGAGSPVLSQGDRSLPDSIRVIPGARLELDPRSPEFIPWSAGSGVIVDDSGLVLTNYHVVERYAPESPQRLKESRPEPSLYVVLQDGRVFQGSIYAADPRTDLAIVRLISDSSVSLTEQPAIEDLKAITFGSVENIQKGTMVLAFGNPYAIARDGSPSVSWGIVSNVGRWMGPTMDEFGQFDRPTLHHYGTLLQTDAKLSLGTSGGALVNLKGEMIGLTTSLAALSGFEQSAGYAIPLDSIMRFTIDILKKGREREYGFLGINLGPSQRPTAEGIPGGILVGKVFAGTPASWAGMLRGDVIIRVNGMPIHHREDLTFIVGTLPVGRLVPVEILREGKSFQQSVILGKFPMRERNRVIATVKRKLWRGVRVDYATARYEIMSRQPLPQQGSVLVIHVEPGSIAETTGLKENDLITHVFGQTVRTPEEFYQKVDSVKDGAVLLAVDQRGEITLSGVGNVNGE
ncbi:MAG: trypsin-like peptidase domain-containing protein [Planctomycetota bacterium]|nr:trypsin-like peptidase domain-containing protein [Planctomycetota bacterium]